MKLGNMPELEIFSDADMAEAMKAATDKERELLVVANGFTAVLASREAPASAWIPLGRGDFGLKSGAAAVAPAGAGHLWWQDTDAPPVAFDLTATTPVRATQAGVETWLDSANALTKPSGRGASPRSEDMDELGYLAAWRCQFSGCGKDLQTHTSTGVMSKSSYFAHIIASSPKGPRGDPLLSDQRSADIENFLLLCDECHRRIDREDPDRFTIAVLQKMREESIAEVRRLLASLQYPEAVPIVLMGNITAQSPHFVAREAEEALWTRKLRMKRGHWHAFFENGWNQYDPHSGAYWSSLFSSLEGELPQLRKFLRTDAGASGTTPLAVFPLHGTSVLILAGRLFGEASAVSLFQFRRERSPKAEGGRWAFDSNVAASSGGKYCLTTRHPHADGAEEACLIISLTFRIAPDRLPPDVVENGAFRMGALEVSSSETLYHDILSGEADIDLVSQRLGEAVRVLQDDWGVKRVHLFVGAPASVCFKLGQKLQARNHATYRCYESEPRPNGTFLPTIEIDNREVRALRTMESLKLA
ncbi:MULTISPECIES: SAVED domain-containing protein [Burkholderia cepacia complex]|uniref:SAVED domain-containing protein n=1 Tax=Burkholderia cepacia complex TaxID=87882 RepID=UPI001CF48F4D|nr:MULTISPECIES: SAVED domain-containing protein [Burkholderia cepacia complex]MCA8057143.1 SAVED domain-containing protein [Burkholderia cepacia]MDN7534667.1 SAVED domain-containing protein [Burkholderia orbicola]